ncbi:MAG: sarcosine oxidase subunit gamma [Shimia sp.]
MVKLIDKSPAADLLPRDFGPMRLEEMTLPLTALGVLKGGDLGAALKAAHGLDLPAPGKMTGSAPVLCLWFGYGHYLLTVDDPDPRLSEVAAVTEQTDAWTHVALGGPGAAEALARLVPIDLRAAAFPPGSVAKTQIGHMNGLVAHLADGHYGLLVFRSMAATPIHEVEAACMEIAARQG